MWELGVSLNRTPNLATRPSARASARGLMTLGPGRLLGLSLNTRSVLRELAAQPDAAVEARCAPSIGASGAPRGGALPAEANPGKRACSSNGRPCELVDRRASPGPVAVPLGTCCPPESDRVGGAHGKDGASRWRSAPWAHRHDRLRLMKVWSGCRFRDVFPRASARPRARRCRSTTDEIPPRPLRCRRRFPRWTRLRSGSGGPTDPERASQRGPGGLCLAGARAPWLNGWSGCLHAAPTLQVKSATPARKSAEGAARSAKPTPCCGARRKPFAQRGGCGALTTASRGGSRRADPAPETSTAWPRSRGSSPAPTLHSRSQGADLTQSKSCRGRGLYDHGGLPRAGRAPSTSSPSTGSGSAPGSTTGSPSLRVELSAYLRGTRPRKSGAAPWLTGRPRSHVPPS